MGSIQSMAKNMEYKNSEETNVYVVYPNAISPIRDSCVEPEEYEETKTFLPPLPFVRELS